MIASHPALAHPALADRLKELWRGASDEDRDEAYRVQQEWVGEYAAIWKDALLLPGKTDLKHSVCLELARLTDCGDLAEVERRCRAALFGMKEDWEKTVRRGDDGTIIEYYDRSAHYAYELMWWHTLLEDDSPLAYVSALHLALKNGCKDSMDFGAGVGSGSLLFARHGMSVALADISTTLQEFCRRRLAARGVPAAFIDLKAEKLPDGAYDFITAMDVFEHIAEPETTIDALAASLRPGGILFGRFAADISEDRPSHIARDFGPAFRRLAGLGFEECWSDDWLWGHKAFRKIS